MSILYSSNSEAIVFLQTLGSYKIPSVMERRRKELFNRLTLLQGGALKSTSPVIDSLDENISSKEERSTVKTPTKEEALESAPSSASSSTVTSPKHGSKVNRRDSLLVSNLVKDYETIHHSARKEEESETPKRFVTLKKVIKPTDFPADATDNDDSIAKKPAETESNSKTTDVKLTQPENKAEQVKLEVMDMKMDTLSIASGVESEEEEGDGKEKKKKSKRGFGHKMKGLMKREKSPAPDKRHSLATDNHAMPDGADGDQDGEEKAEVEEAEEELEEGVRISGMLERIKKKGNKKHKSIQVKVYDTTMILGGKEEVELAHCSVETTDLGFDLSRPQQKSAFMFKVDGEDKVRQKWVTALSDAIQKATPIVEEGEINYTELLSSLSDVI